MIDRGELQTLHDIIQKARDELHRLDGTQTADYAPFENALLEDATKLIHQAYSVAVSWQEATRHANPL